MNSDEGMMQAACVMREAVDRFMLRDFSFDLDRLEQLVQRFEQAVERLVENCGD